MYLSAAAFSTIDAPCRFHHLDGFRVPFSVAPTAAFTFMWVFSPKQSGATFSEKITAKSEKFIKTAFPAFTSNFADTAMV
jgi:hypothetical protein